MNNDYTAIIKAFHKRILVYTVFTRTVPEYPGLKLYFGPGTLENFAEVRRNTPSDDILVYIFPENKVIREDDFYNQMPSPGKSLFIEVSKNSLYEDRISMAASLIKHSSIIFSVDGRLNRDELILAAEIDNVISTAENNNNFRYADRSLTMSLVTTNAAAFCLKKNLTFSTDKKNFPAVVCGAGPSLNSNYDTLKKYRDKLFIIAVGRAFLSLQKNGITPDLVVEVDRIARWNWLNDDVRVDVPLLATPYLSPGIISRFERIIWNETGNFNLIAGNGKLQIPHAPPLCMGISVIVPALDFAIKSGFRNITLIGSDLCFEADGMSHVNQHLSSEHSKRTEMTPLKGNHGETVYAPFFLRNIKKALENFIKRNQATKVFNSSARGAVIDNTKYIPLEDFCDKCCGNPVTDFFEEIPPLPPLVPEKFSVFLKNFTELHRQLASAASDFLKELESKNPDSAKMMECRNLLHKTFEQEWVIRKARNSDFICRIVSLADDLMVEMPVQECSPDTKLSQYLNNIILRHSIIRDFCVDIGKRLDKTISQIYSAKLDEGYLNSLEPFRFDAIRRIAIDFVRHHNTEYAKKLENNAFGNIESEFDFMLQGLQASPAITRLKADGTKHQWSLHNSINEKDPEREDLQSFLLENEYNTDDYSIIFLVPCGWKTIANFNDLHPVAEFMVADPYPELFSELINYCLFTTKLSHKAVIVGIHSDLKRWQKVFQRTVAKWKRTGRKILIYSPSLVKDELEVVSCRVMLEKLIDSA